MRKSAADDARTKPTDEVLAKTDATRLHGKGNCAGPRWSALTALRPANVRLRATCPHWPKAPPPARTNWRHQPSSNADSAHERSRTRHQCYIRVVRKYFPPFPCTAVADITHCFLLQMYNERLERGTWSEAGYWTDSISLAQWHVYGSTNLLHVSLFYAQCTSGFSICTSYAMTVH